MINLIKLLILFGITVSFGCKTKHLPPTPVEFKSLRNYVLKPGSTFTEADKFKFITSEAEFLTLFTLTKSSPETIVVPDFSKDNVAVIILPPTEKVISLDITNAEVAGKILTFFYSITDTASFSSYPHTPLKMVIVKKNLAVQKVNFLKGTTLVKSLKVAQ